MANELSEIESEIKEREAEIEEQRKKLEELELLKGNALFQKIKGSIDEWITASEKFQETLEPFCGEIAPFLRKPGLELFKQLQDEMSRVQEVNSNINSSLKAINQVFPPIPMLGSMLTEMEKILF